MISLNTSYEANLRHSFGFWYLDISIVLFYVKLDDNSRGLRICGKNGHILRTHFEKIYILFSVPTMLIKMKIIFQRLKIT